MLSYEVVVEGVEVDGHPIANFATNLTIASDFYDVMVKKYPYNSVILKVNKVDELKRSVPLRRPTPVCPRGCDRTLNGKHNIAQGSKEKHYCSICSWRET